MPKKSISDETTALSKTGEKEIREVRSSLVMMQDGGDVQNIPRSIEIVEFKSHDDVRVTPSFIEFKDASEGMTFRELLTIQNIGKDPALVRIGPPNSIAFRIKPLEHGVLLSPGLRIMRWVNYSYKRLSVLHALIPITINGTTLGYHVFCTLATECIKVEPSSVDFGIVDIGCSSGVKLITIENIGGKSTRFAVDLGSNDIELNVKPMRGLVRPRSQVYLKVELIGILEGTFYSEFWIKSSPNVRMLIKVNIIIPRLVVYHPNTTGDFTLIDFPPTFIETQRHDTLVLRNLSSQVSNFVVLGEIDNELLSIQSIDRQKHPAYGVFKIYPLEGRMDPFEGLIFNIIFSPTVKVIEERQNCHDSESKDFMAFVRILRVHCTEVEDIIRPNDAYEPTEDAVHKVHILEATSVSSESTDESSPVQPMYETVRLCLHGETETPQLQFVPNELDLGDILIKESVNREVTIKNISMNTKVEFQFVPNVAAHCLPQTGWIQPNGSIEVLLTVTSKWNVESPLKLIFDVIVLSSGGIGSKGVECKKAKPCWLLCRLNPIVPSQKKLRTKFTLGKSSAALLARMTVEEEIDLEFDPGGELSVTAKELIETDFWLTDPLPTGRPIVLICTLHISSIASAGISPYLTSEVGENTEQATFGSNIKKPRQAMLLVNRDPSKYWADKTLIRVDAFPDSIPAFPNDTQRSLRPWTGGDVRSIFTGTLRYSPGPDYQYTLTPEEVLLRTYQRVQWSKYLRIIQNRKEKIAQAKKKTLNDGWDEEPEDFCHVLDIPVLDRRSLARRMLKQAMSSKLVEKAKDEMLVPLSPLQIYNVKVSPTIFTYGTVAPKSVNYRKLTIENKNNFAVMLRLVSLVARCISFPEGSVMILQPGMQITKLVEYHAAYVGKFNTYIDYVINDNHSFELTITADVIYKSLTLGTKEIVFGLEYLPEEANRPYGTYVEVKNKLDAKTTFTWEVPASASFSVDPTSGVVRGLRTLFVEVSYEPNASKAHIAEIVLVSEGGTYANLNLSTILTMPDVAFINDTLNLGRIPLNMMTTAIGVLHNAEFTEVMYEVNPESLLYGCEIYPEQGIIAPRGIIALEVRLKFDACIKFSIAIQVMVQKCLQLQLKLNGQVSFPMLKLSPEIICVRRISADAFATHLIAATNIGKSVLKIQIMLDEYPEYRASLSPNRRDPGLGKEGVTILPDFTLSIYLHFIPIDMASYSFYLPIVLNDMLGPVVAENSRSLKPSEFLKTQEEHYTSSPGISLCPLPPKLATVYIDCTVAGHVISFSKLIFHFDVMENELNDELRVFNEASQETSFIIRTDDFHEIDCPFSIRWIHGVKPTFAPQSIVCTLHPGEDTVFLIEFEPTDQGFFSMEAPIFIRGELEGNMFNILLLDGDNATSSIESNITSVYFPPVPLNVEVEQKITLIVSHFKDFAKIFATVLVPSKCVGQFTEDTIQVKFPGGNVISGKQRSEELDVYILFSSSTAVSFTTKLEICDNLSLALCTVNVCATADNCVMTTHSFLRSTKESHKIHRPEAQESYPSITSDDEDIVSLIKSQVVPSRKHTDASVPRVSLHSNVSRTSRNASRSLNSNSIGKIKSMQIEDEKEIVDEEEEDLVTLSSKGSLSGVAVKSAGRASKPVYPHFPTGSSDSDCHMQRALKAAEEWMYTGPLKCNFYPSIVDGITGVLSGVCSIKATYSDRRKSHTVNQSFIDILVALGGPDISKYIGDATSLPEDEMERVTYVLKLYENILEFLTTQGACLPHVTPEFLLSYNDYLLSGDPMKCNTASTTSVNADDILYERMPRDLFESRSKQCWLDVALQSFKTLVLTRVSLENLQDNLISNLSRRSMEMTITSAMRQKLRRVHTSIDHQGYKTDNLMSTVQETKITEFSVSVTDSGIYSVHEKVLLGWMTHSYEEQRTMSWMVDDRVSLNPMEARDVPEPRIVGNFENDLSDGLVLIAVTVTYCPYLIDEYFNNIYICPTTPEEMHHNAICLVTAWRKVRLGFMITPRQIVRPISVQMVMLVTHLFQTLPSLVPKAKVRFSCGLTESVTRQVSFSNPSDFPVDYVVQFINNPGFFTAIQPQTILHLNPHDSGHVKIQFTAKKILKTKTYLLMCGAAIAPNFAKNHTFSLEGCANQLGVTNNYDIVSKLYEVRDETLSIPVPYKEAADYDISVTEEKPTKPSLLKMAKWSELRLRKVPRRLYLNQKALSVAEDSLQASLSLTVACIAPNPRSFWIVFQSKVGDFIIQINSFSKKSTTDHITIVWDREECVCSDPPTGICSTCPLNIQIMIPSRNVDLWNCISLMFQKTLNPKERLFWSRHLDTNIGLRLIHWLMGDHNDSAAQECNHIFNTSVTYTVTTMDKASPLTIPTEFTIPDVRPREELIEMSVHILQSTPAVYETKLLLSSPDDKELRSYKVDFLCRTPATPPKPPKREKKKRSFQR